jgi:hypothetical protein
MENVEMAVVEPTPTDNGLSCDQIKAAVERLVQDASITVKNTLKEVKAKLADALHVQTSALASFKHDILAALTENAKRAEAEPETMETEDAAQEQLGEDAALNQSQAEANDLQEHNAEAEEQDDGPAETSDNEDDEWALMYRKVGIAYIISMQQG